MTSYVNFCLITCRYEVVDHFAAFYSQLPPKQTIIYADQSSSQKWQEYRIGVIPFDLKMMTAEEEVFLVTKIAKTHSKAHLVLTDLGHKFAYKLQQAFIFHAPSVNRIVYYHSLEPYVPGGYSKLANQIISLAEVIFFANSRLASSPIFHENGYEINCDQKPRIGIGYFPLHSVDALIQLRKNDQLNYRKAFFDKYQLKDQGQKIIVYFSGNQVEYFTRAFPTFLSFLNENFSNYLFILQKDIHTKNIKSDEETLKAWRTKNNFPNFVISEETTEWIQIIADKVLYYQSPLVPSLLLANIPIIQIGHHVCDDVLTKNNLIPTVTQSEQLFIELNNEKLPCNVEVMERLGIQLNGSEIFKRAVSDIKPKKTSLSLQKIAIIASTLTIISFLSWKILRK